MPKLDRAVRDPEEPVALGGIQCVGWQARFARCPHHRCDLVSVVERGDQQSGLRLGGQPLHALHEGRP